MGDRGLGYTGSYLLRAFGCAPSRSNIVFRPIRTELCMRVVACSKEVACASTQCSVLVPLWDLAEAAEDTFCSELSDRKRRVSKMNNMKMLSGYNKIETQRARPRRGTKDLSDGHAHGVARRETENWGIRVYWSNE